MLQIRNTIASSLTGFMYPHKILLFSRATILVAHFFLCGLENIYNSVILNCFQTLLIGREKKSTKTYKKELTLL